MDFIFLSNPHISSWVLIIFVVAGDIFLKNISPATTNIIKTHDDMWGLLKNIKSIGAGNPFKDGDNSLARGSILKKMAEIYNDRFKIKDSRLTTCNSQLATRNRIYATYEVMFVYCKK